MLRHNMDKTKKEDKTQTETKERGARAVQGTNRRPARTSKNRNQLHGRQPKDLENEGNNC